MFGAEEVEKLGIKEKLYNLQVDILSVFVVSVCIYHGFTWRKNRQRRGSCGHIMASFDLHIKCARCQEKGIGDDDCVGDKPCAIYNNFTEAKKKTGVLLSPDDVPQQARNFEIRLNPTVKSG